MPRTRSTRALPLLVWGGLAIWASAPTNAPLGMPGSALAWAGPSEPISLLASPEPPSADTLGVRGRIDSVQLLDDLRILAHDSMEGRRTGTPGNVRARQFLRSALETRGGPGLGEVGLHSFSFVGRQDAREQEGVNVLAHVSGSVHPDRYLVISAHYDHLGVEDGTLFPGADDNASGTAGLLALAEWFSRNPPRHSLLFVAFDAEEMGLQGARAFVADPPVPLEQILLLVNLDMVSRSEAGELYVAGTYHSPFLAPWVEEIAAQSRLRLRMGHDRPDLPPGEDWTLSSDHGPFHQAGIPFLYFGVEDHPGYHSPSDTWDAITPEFYVEAIETILDAILLLDRRGERLLSAPGLVQAFPSGTPSPSSRIPEDEHHDRRSLPGTLSRQ